MSNPKIYEGKECIQGHGTARYKSNRACVVCQKAKAKAWGQKNPTSETTRKRKWEDNNRPRQILWQVRNRARKTGVPFDLKPEDVVVPETCPVLGIKLDWTTHNGGPTPNSPSVDRLVPELGYVSGNVCVISMKANQIKSNATAAEVRAVAEWMEVHGL